MRRGPRSVAAGLAVISLGVVAAAAAQEPDKATCADAYVKGQLARQDGRLRDARDLFFVCSQAACPLVTARDCLRWRDEVADQIPTVVFDMRTDAGEQVGGARVLMDGQPIVERLDGRAVPVDPGKHDFSFEVAGKSAIHKVVTILEGLKAQRVDVVVEGASGARDSALFTPEIRQRPTPVAVYVLGGVGVAGLLSFTIWGLRADQQESDLRSTCAPYCPAYQHDSIHTKQIVADVSLGVGLVAVGVATVLYLTRPVIVSKGRSDRGWVIRPDLFGASGEF